MLLRTLAVASGFPNVCLATVPMACVHHFYAVIETCDGQRKRLRGVGVRVL
jgi:hypothetical protein